jgi:iron complex outermembrane receptor protein
VDWSALAVDNWQTIDVGKGAFSAKYGNTLGGTINLIPAQPGADPTASASVGYKRYDTYSAGASAAARTASMGACFSAGYMETDGHLRNSQAERTSVAGNLFYYWGDDGTVNASVRYTDGEYGMPVANQSDDAGYDPEYPESLASMLIGPGIRFRAGDTFGDGSTYTKKRTELDLGVTRTVAGVASELKVYFNTEDREDTFYSFNDDETVLKRECEPDRSWGWVSRFEKQLADHRIGFGADGNYQGY